MPDSRFETNGDDDPVIFDSGDSDLVIVAGVGDTTVRPMREVLRRVLEQKRTTQEPRNSQES